MLNLRNIFFVLFSVLFSISLPVYTNGSNNIYVFAIVSAVPTIFVLSYFFTLVGDVTDFLNEDLGRVHVPFLIVVSSAVIGAFRQEWIVVYLAGAYFFIMLLNHLFGTIEGLIDDVNEWGDVWFFPVVKKSTVFILCLPFRLLWMAIDIAIATILLIKNFFTFTVFISVVVSGYMYQSELLVFLTQVHKAIEATGPGNGDLAFMFALIGSVIMLVFAYSACAYLKDVERHEKIAQEAAKAEQARAEAELENHIQSILIDLYEWGWDGDDYSESFKKGFNSFCSFLIKTGTITAEEAVTNKGIRDSIANAVFDIKIRQILSGHFKTEAEIEAERLVEEMSREADEIEKLVEEYKVEQDERHARLLKLFSDDEEESKTLTQEIRDLQNKMQPLLD